MKGSPPPLTPGRGDPLNSKPTPPPLSRHRAERGRGGRLFLFALHVKGNRHEELIDRSCVDRRCSCGGGFLPRLVPLWSRQRFRHGQCHVVGGQEQDRGGQGQGRRQSP